MLKQEFETLVGYEVSPNKYEIIEKVYMSLDTDKQDFCTMWKSASPEARNYMEAMALRMESEFNKKQEIIDNLTQEVNHIIKEAFESTHKMADSRLREVCINHFGKAGYIRMVLNSGYNLWEDDKKMLLEILSKEQ